MRIQHNIPAMNAYRNYTANVSALSKNLEKLSSGYKINRAGDDAAGLAISEKMRAQITGLETAQKNAKDGISLVQTAEGALTEVHDMLNRMYELAEQSANGTYDDDVDRVQLQKEIESLRTEINRIADSSNFNGIKLLDGSLDSATHVTSEAGEFEIEGTGNGALPAVGDNLNVATNTVLHKGASTKEAENAFGVELHSAKIEGDKDDEFTLKIGNTTLTGKLLGTAKGDTAITAEDLAKALAGTDTTKISFKVGAANYDPNEIAINGGKFKAEISATGKGVTFTQTDNTDLTGDGVVMDVTLAKGTNNTPTGTSPTVTATAGTDAGKTGAFTAGTPDNTGTGTMSLTDLSAGTTPIGAGNIGSITGKLTIGTGAGQVEVDLDQLKTDSSIDGSSTPNDFITALNAALATAVTAAKTAGDATKADYTEYSSITATATSTGISYTYTSTTQTWDPNGGSNAAATAGKLVVDFTGKTGADVAGSNITIDGKTYEFVKNNADAKAGNVAVVVADADTADAMATKLVTAMAAKGGNVGTVAVDGADNKKVNVAYGTAGASVTLAHAESNAVDVPVAVSGQYNWQTTDQSVKSTASDDILASTAFTLTKDMATAGASVRIGEETYTFTDDAKAAEKDTKKIYVGDLDYDKNAGDLATAVQRFTDAAAGNATWTVGQKGGQVTLTEVKGYTTGKQKYDLSKTEGIEESLGFTTATSSTGKGKGLSLQIGDTSEKFNKLTVDVSDCHAAAMGIGDIDISTQDGASAAMNKIKDAINYVSDVRGSLGALQNRLDHTINNLSVMQENIQDAESTIRDVDVAQEMMAYTKNSILVQSAQAMLAQANQLPQGVLQLLG